MQFLFQEHQQKLAIDSGTKKREGGADAVTRIALRGLVTLNSTNVEKPAQATFPKAKVVHSWSDSSFISNYLYFHLNMGTFILIILLFIFFYLAYKLFVYAGKKIIHSDLRKEIIDAEVTETSSKLKIKIKEWFSWSVQTNNEKGTAGGNIKINFPIKSALLLAIICIVIAIICLYLPPTALLLPLIFFSFAVYYFRKWIKSLRTLNNEAKGANKRQQP